MRFLTHQDIKQRKSAIPSKVSAFLGRRTGGTLLRGDVGAVGLNHAKLLES
jgi:hypothetical protein